MGTRRRRKIIQDGSRGSVFGVFEGFSQVTLEVLEVGNV